MRAGGSKQKGASFERDACRLLSLWVSHGKSEDLFWRSAMSGGRATVARKKGKVLARQAGDISAVAPEGHVLTDRYYIELKHVKDLQLLQFFFKGTGHLHKFWETADREARAHNRRPLVIARQNKMPTLLICPMNAVFRMTGSQPVSTDHVAFQGVEIWRLDDVLRERFKLKPRKPSM